MDSLLSHDSAIDRLPSVSIVTPSLNVAAYLESAIQNVLAQGYPKAEHLIIDGASTDGTIEVLDRYPSVRWISEPDRGQSDALNKGFHMARGEVLGWLNADDSYTQGAIFRAARHLIGHPDCDLVYGDCNIVDEHDRIVRVFRSREVGGIDKLLAGVIHTPSVFWRRGLFDRVGYLDEHLHYAMDNEFWLRMAPIVRQQYLPGAMANFRLRSGSKATSQEAEFGLEMCRVYEETFAIEPWASQVPTDVKDRLLAATFWRCGVELCRQARFQEAKPYLNKAVNRYGALDHPNLVLERLVVHYTTGRPFPPEEVFEIVRSLPIGAAEQRQVRQILKNGYWLTRFFAIHNGGDRSKVRKAGLNLAFHQPQRLLHRGFLSLWGESLFGKRLADLARRVIV